MRYRLSKWSQEQNRQLVPSLLYQPATPQQWDMPFKTSTSTHIQAVMLLVLSALAGCKREWEHALCRIHSVNWQTLLWRIITLHDSSKRTCICYNAIRKNGTWDWHQRPTDPSNWRLASRPSARRCWVNPATKKTHTHRSKDISCLTSKLWRHSQHFFWDNLKEHLCSIQTWLAYL